MSNRLLDLRKIIDRADNVYYNTGGSWLTDDQYDALKKELKQLAPDDERHTRVGAPVPANTMLQKVKHTRFMGSLDKADDKDGLRKWYQNIYRKLTIGQAERGMGEVHVSLKIDGSSIALYYEHGKLIRAVTRGGDDGVGEDVTANALNFIGVPTTLNLPLSMTVRGECVLEVADWLKLDPTQHSNPRNIGNGIVGRSNGVDSEKLKFIAFDYCGTNSGQKSHDIEFQSAALGQLAEWGFVPVMSWRAKNIEEALVIYDDIAARRDTMPYWIDGVVFQFNDLILQRELGVSSNRPRGQHVLKFEAEGADTTLLDVVLSMGHTGYIVPNGILAPVRIGGTTVSNVLLNNYDIISALDIAIGDKVHVIKAKDIIPKVIRVVEKAPDRVPIVEPTQCPVCGGPVGRLKVGKKQEDGAITVCKSPDCPAKADGRLKTWIKKLDIQGIGDGLLAVLIEKELAKTPADLYRLDVDKIAGLIVGKGRLGHARATEVINNIQAKREIPIHMFMGSLGIKHLGRRRAALIMEAAPGKFDTLDDWLNVDKLRSYADAVGIPTMIDGINAGIRAFSDEIADLRQYVTISSPKDNTMMRSPSMTTAGALAGRTFCFTGKIEKTDESGKRYTRDRMQQLVVDAGGSTSDDVRAGVTDLVQADPTSTSSKTQKANKLGVHIMAEADFFKLVGK